MRRVGRVLPRGVPLGHPHDERHPEFRYTTFGEESDAVAGVMDAAGMLPDGEPSFWAIYFAVDDTDTALARVVELGGAVITGAEDSPHGRLATAADTTGARFELVAD